MIVCKPSTSLVRQGFSGKVVMPWGMERGKPLLIGEAPGKTEDETDIPFHPEAEAGGLFKRLMERVGVKRERFAIANCVWQRPPGNELYDDHGNPLPYTEEALAYWRPFLQQLIEEMQPSVIIGLGETALRELTGFDSIGEMRGYVHHYNLFHNSQVFGFDCPVTCTYHPAFLNYGSRYLSGVFIRDVLAGLEIAEKGWERPRLKVEARPSPDDFRWFVGQYNAGKHHLTYDIENPDSRTYGEEVVLDGTRRISYEIDRMSFCYDREIGGWSVPFEEPFISLAKPLLASLGPKRGHNCRLHDRPRLEAKGLAVNGREYDTLDMWKHLNRTLPASLGFIAPFYLSIPPWKHEAHTQPEWYSGMDAIVQHEVAEGISADLRSSGQWEVYERHVVDILSLGGKMSANGLPMDEEKRKELEVRLQADLKEKSGQLQKLVPNELKVVKPAQGYKTLPKKVKAQIESGQLRHFDQKRKKNAKTGEITFSEEWFEFVQQNFSVPIGKMTKAEKSIDVGSDMGSDYCLLVRRWCKRLDFNPNSHTQKKKLIKAFGHRLKTNRKTKEETSDDNTLKSLIQQYGEMPKHQVAVECYKLIRECVAISKVLGTYVKGWKPGPDGLIHATPGIWGDMFRISWRGPNLAATVADKKEVQIASGFRECICVSDDQLIIECDWKSMEAVLLAYFADDLDYMRLSKLSTNAYLASHILRRPADLSWSDSVLGAYLSEIKNDDRNVKVYDDAKHTCYLIAYGGTPFLMSELYDMDRGRAQWLFDLFFDLFPKIKLWQQSVIQEAYDKCSLTNGWGYRMPFWDVYRWNQKRYDKVRQLWVESQTAANPAMMRWSKSEVEWQAKVSDLVASGLAPDRAISKLCWDLGDEAKSALAFKPRDTGAAMLKDAMLALEDEHALADFGIMRACAHDAILSIAPKTIAEQVAWNMKEIMERPQSRLGGLVIEAEVKAGQSWSKKAMKVMELKKEFVA